MYQSMKCEPPETPPAGGMGVPPPNTTPTASAGILISSGGLSSGGYKVPEASNNWKAEVKRIWNKPVEQLPIGIDLPRLANSIFVPSLSNTDQPPQPRPLPGKEEEAKEGKEEGAKEDATEPTPMDTTTTTPTGDAPVPTPTPTPPTTSEPASTAEGAPAAAPAPPVDDEIDVKAREIMHTLYNMGRFIEDDEYAQKLVDNFGSFVILEGAKDRDMTREIARLVAEYLGKESRMVRVLKACNQAIIAPAVIELTLNVCAKVPFKDAGGWRMELTKNEDGLITVTHVKQQRARSSNKEDEFSFEWHLEIIFDEGLTGLSDMFLSIPKLNFGPHVSPSTMEGIQYTFAPYLVRR